MIKRTVRRGIRWLGYDVVPTGARGRAVLLDAFDRIMAQPGLDLVIDVGANIGQFCGFLRGDVGYTGRVISFEPNPEAFAICSARSAGDPGWEVYPWALGDREESLMLNLSGELSSFRGIDPNGETRYSATSFEASTDVKVRRLDNVMIELGIDTGATLTLLKVDTQGFEMEVFRGAPETVRSAVALLPEVSQLPIYENCSDFQDVIRFLRMEGFDVAAMAPVTFHDGAVVEFDCMLVNRARARGIAI